MSGAMSLINHQWRLGEVRSGQNTRLTRTQTAPPQQVIPSDVPPAYETIEQQPSSQQADDDVPDYTAPPLLPPAPAPARDRSTSPNPTPNVPVDAAPAGPTTRPSFTLNGKELTSPLITVKTVKQHLRLLASFARLRKDVLENKEPALEAAGISDEDRWSIYLVRAHHRFENWLTARTCEPETYDLPTADFLFIWYTYLVHPRTYVEDNGHEAISRGFELERATALIDSETDRLARPPHTGERLVLEQEWYGMNVNIPLAVKPDPTINDIDHIMPITCPKCRQEQYICYLSLKTPTAGYAHRDFRHECRHCGMIITREILSVARFALTLLLFMRERIYLAGTQLHPTTGRPDGFFAATINTGMLQPFCKLCAGCQTVGAIGDKLNWSLDVVERILRASPMGWPLPERVSKIMSCYSQPQFSIDLVASARRQCLFIDELEALGWLKLDAFDEDSSALEAAIARYHQYLDLVATQSSLKHVFVPTLDINLVMQAHQVNAAEYKKACHLTLGILPDNNQLLPEKEFVAAYEKTSRMYKTRFKASYSNCGCERSAFGQKVSSALKITSRRATSFDDVIAVLTASEEANDVVVDRDTITRKMPLIATHPCVHCMIVDPLTRSSKKVNKVPVECHQNTLLFPSPSILPVLDPASGYGYGPVKAVRSPVSRPTQSDGSLRQWMTR